MSYKFTLLKESLKRSFSIYIVIGRKNLETLLYVGKTGDNRAGCNPVISRCGNHFSYNKIHSQVRNYFVNHEEYIYTYLFNDFFEYNEEDPNLRLSIDSINELERWANLEVQSLIKEIKNVRLLNPFKNSLKISKKESEKRNKIRNDAENEMKINNLINNLKFELKSINLSQIFENEPESWGLRGDPFLWEDLKEKLSQYTIEKSNNNIETILKFNFEILTGHNIDHEDQIFLEKYKNNGMSSGHIDVSGWRNNIIPLLVNNYINLTSSG